VVLSPYEAREYVNGAVGQRGITHVDLISPRVVSLSGFQLAWSPSTAQKGIHS